MQKLYITTSLTWTLYTTLYHPSAEIAQWRRIRMRADELACLTFLGAAAWIAEARTFRTFVSLRHPHRCQSSTHSSRLKSLKLGATKDWWEGMDEVPALGGTTSNSVAGVSRPEHDKRWLRNPLHMSLNSLKRLNLAGHLRTCRMHAVDRNSEWEDPTLGP